MRDIGELARQRVGIIVLAIAVGGTCLLVLRRSAQPPAAGVATATDAGAETAAPAPVASDGLVPAPRPEPTADPASRATPRPSDAPPTCEPPLVAVEERLPLGRVRHGCMNRSGDARGTREGRWVVLEKDGRITSGLYANDLQEGDWTTWYPNGVIERVLPMKAGATHGVAIEFAPTGARASERSYRRGTLDGPATITYADGTVVHQEWRLGTRLTESTEK